MPAGLFAIGGAETMGNSSYWAAGSSALPDGLGIGCECLTTRHVTTNLPRDMPAYALSLACFAAAG
jgi:hypothetical protein